MPRLALEMHRRRADLLRAFPDPLGADREPLALWYATHGRAEYRLPDPVVQPVLRTLPWRKQAWARLWWRRESGRLRARQSRAAERPAQETRETRDRRRRCPSMPRRFRRAAGGKG